MKKTIWDSLLPRRPLDGTYGVYSWKGCTIFKILRKVISDGDGCNFNLSGAKLDGWDFDVIGPNFIYRDKPWVDEIRYISPVAYLGRLLLNGRFIMYFLLVKE